MKTWSWIIPILCILFSDILIGQDIDSVLIENIQIVSSPITSSSNDTYLEGSLDETIDEVLFLSSDLFLKSNGPGSSVTTSLLGGTASHTTLTIHGVPVTNPLIGQADFSLIPIFFNQSLSLQTGASEAITTTGSIAGNIDISDSGRAKPTLKVGSVYRSFRNLESYVSYNLLTSRLDLSANVSRLDAKNNYGYQIDGIDNTRFTQEHAENTATNIYLNGTYHLSDSQSIEGWYWWQDQWRNIPPTTVQTTSQQSQTDQFHKGGLIHRYQTDRLSLTSKIGYTDQEIGFIDDAILLENNGAFTSQYYESILRLRQDKDIQLSIGYQGDFNQASNGGFAEDNNLTTQRLLLGAKRQRLLDNTTFLLRVINSNLEDVPISTSGYLSQSYTNASGGVISGSIRKLWRAPSMNDLYWAFGGNPDLGPEKGWEVNLEYVSTPSTTLRLQTNVFSRWVNDFILWSPSEELGGLFRAGNVSSVWSRGILFDLAWSRQYDAFDLIIKTNHSLIYSSPNETIESTFLAKDAQLIYIPIYASRLMAQARRNNTIFRLQSSVTTQYTGINDDVDGYTLFDVYVGHTFGLGGGSKLQIGIEAINILDETYVVIERRPMPGRHFKVSFNYLYSKSDK